MIKNAPLIFLTVLLLLFRGSYAAANENVPSFEKLFIEIGYKTVGEARGDAERHFKQELKLPVQIPPISFTHYFGRFNDLDDEVNDSFEAVLIHEASTEHRYKIEVRPLAHKIPISDKYVMEKFILKDEEEAVYMGITGIHALVFEKEGWQYMLSVDKRISDKVPPDVLVDIADSIEY